MVHLGQTFLIIYVFGYFSALHRSFFQLGAIGTFKWLLLLFSFFKLHEVSLLTTLHSFRSLPWETGLIQWTLPSGSGVICDGNYTCYGSQHVGMGVMLGVTYGMWGTKWNIHVSVSCFIKQFMIYMYFPCCDGNDIIRRALIEFTSSYSSSTYPLFRILLVEVRRGRFQFKRIPGFVFFTHILLRRRTWLPSIE